jgi:quercetin dioxygenase-like cupin family protein
MQIQNVAFDTVDWSSVPEVGHPGETGVATWRTIEAGNIRVRRVDYSPGYLADHWCRRGHVLLVLSGQLLTELEDGRTVSLKAGQSYHVADNTMAHRSRTESGASLFIVD